MCVKTHKVGDRWSTDRTDRTDRTDWRSGTQRSSHWLSAAVWTHYHLHDRVIISGKRFDLLHLGRTASYTSSQREREGNARTLIVLPLGNADRYLSDFCSYSVIFNSIHEKKTKKKTQDVCVLEPARARRRQRRKRRSILQLQPSASSCPESTFSFLFLICTILKRIFDRMRHTNTVRETHTHTHRLFNAAISSNQTHMVGQAGVPSAHWWSVWLWMWQLAVHASLHGGFKSLRLVTS